MRPSWRTVRVFISSTFRDMHAERDHLAKVVFPELRERMAQQHLYLVDVDLRWGVTEAEAENGKVLEVCLDEISRSRPFFIGILGERYGSVLDTISKDTVLAHSWLPEYTGHSLTALEIVHGVLRNPDLARRSFFYFRDPQFITQIPDSKRIDYVAEDAEAECKLAALKDKIRASGRPVLENYSCRWDDAQTRLVDLGVFGQRVLEDLWTAICMEYPEEAPEIDPLIIERQMHEAFAEERARLHIGRLEQAARLTEYVQSTDRRPVVITGESGCGKSAFLASWYRQYAADHPSDFVLAYFIGASPASTNHLRLLRNMCGELRRQFGLKEEIPQDDEKLSETLAMLLFAAGQTGSRIVIVVDALDQLSPLEGAHGLGWLLNYMPEKTRLVVSTLEGDGLDVLRRREAEEIRLLPLTPDEQRRIVQTVLGEWRRKLDDKQMTALLAHPGVSSPLYLRVALEELRLFGRFEELTARIEALSENVVGLFDQVLARLEEDHGLELVREALSLLGCSRYGLSEVELLELLRREGEEQLPRALWARLARGAKAYLVQRGELINFFHRQLAEAVTLRYLNQESKHAKLAAYFASATVERKLDEYPYQLQHAEDWQTLAATLSDLDFFDYAWEHNRKYEWFGYWRALQGRFKPGPCYQATINARTRLEGEKTQLVRLLHNIGLFLIDLGLYHSALPFVKQELDILRNAYGSNHPDVARSLNVLGFIYHQIGRLSESVRVCEQALEIAERTLGKEHRELASILDNLAYMYGHVASSGGKQVSFVRREVAILERDLGPNHPDVARALDHLGNEYKYFRDKSIAFSPLLRSLTIRENVFGPEHPEVAESLNGLGSLYTMCGNYAEALPPILRSLSIRKRVLGDDHPDVAESLHNLACVYLRQNKWVEAERFFEGALAIFERVHGRDHQRLMFTVNGQVEALFAQKKYDKAMFMVLYLLRILLKSMRASVRLDILSWIALAVLTATGIIVAIYGQLMWGMIFLLYGFIVLYRFRGRILYFIGVFLGNLFLVLPALTFLWLFHSTRRR